MTYSGTLVGTDASTENNTANCTLQWADVGSFAANDIALIFWGHSNAAAFNAESTKPSGFTAEVGIMDGNCVFGLWSKVLTGSESGTITLSNTGAATRQNACIIVVRGYTGIDATATAADAGTDGNHTAPSATPSVADVGVIIANSEKVTSGSTSMTAPAGYTNAVVGSAVGSGGQFVGVAYEGSAGSITGTHTASVSISPGTMVNNVSASDDGAITVLLIPSVTSLSTGATVSETGTIAAAGVVGKAVGAALAFTDTITSAGVVGRSTGASISETATVTAAGAVGKSSGASLAETATVTAAGAVGTATGASIAATGTISATGVVGADITAGATISAVATITATGVVAQAQMYFTPPTVDRTQASPGGLWGRYSVPVGQSVVRINGSLKTVSYPWIGELQAAGSEGTDWFLGGRTYPVSSATAAELNSAGYVTTT